MSGNDELERDIREEDQLRELLRTPDRSAVPSFSTVAMRAQHASSGRTAVGALAALLVVVAGLALLRPEAPPATTPSASPSSGTGSAAPGCAQPSSLDLQRHSTGSSLTASLVSVRPTDPQTNQLWWTVRYLAAADAKGPATISLRAQVTASGRSFQQILGYDQLEPAQRSLSDGELLTIAPCQAATFTVRTGGLLDGTFPYELVIEKVGLPEGGTVTDRFQLTLTCDTRPFTCAPVATNATPGPTATPNASLIKPGFGVIYWGVRQGYEKNSAPLVRREGEADRAVGELAASFFNQFNGQVSPDGRRAVYFAQRQGEPWALYLLDGATPNDQRKLLEIPGEIPYGRPIWAGDGTGVVFTVADAGADQGVTPKLSALRTLDITTGAVLEVARLTDSSTYGAVGWDRSTKKLAALISPHGSPGRSYVVFSQTGPSPVGRPSTFTRERTTDLDAEYQLFAAPDAQQVAGVRCTPTAGCSLWMWPLAEFESRKDQKIGDRLALGFIGFRPGTSDIGLVTGDASGATLDRIELWSPAAGRRTAYRILDGRVPDAAFFRADGSALLISQRLGEVILVDLATGATTALPQPSPQAPFEFWRPAASIRLG